MSDQSRRKLLKSIAAGSGAIVAGKSLPESWSTPVVDSVLLPAHALTSSCTTINVSFDITASGGAVGTVGYGYDIYLASGGGSIDGAGGSVTFQGDPLDTTYSHTYGPGQYLVYAAASGGDPGTGESFTARITVSCCTGDTVILVDLVIVSGGTNGEGGCALVTIGEDGSCMVEPSTGCPSFSDIRLKTNIEALSISREGYNLYKFQYIDDKNENTYVGIMAQDILSRNPEAVIQNESGFYMVRYAQLGLKMVTLEQWESEGPDSVELLH